MDGGVGEGARLVLVPAEATRKGRGGILHRGEGKEKGLLLGLDLEILVALYLRVRELAVDGVLKGRILEVNKAGTVLRLRTQRDLDRDLEDEQRKIIFSKDSGAILRTR